MVSFLLYTIRKKEKINIFVVNDNPVRAAHELCDEHVVKMTLETAQMLCAAYDPGVAPYRRTHYNHHCTVWARKTPRNYMWLIEHGLALATEFEFRFQKIHKCKSIINWCAANMRKIKFVNKSAKLTEFAQCMPERFKVSNDAVSAYRKFYIYDKAKFATWQRGVCSPEWWPCIELEPVPGEYYLSQTEPFDNSFSFGSLLFCCGLNPKNISIVEFLFEDDVIQIPRKHFHTQNFKLLNK